MLCCTHTSAHLHLQTPLSDRVGTCLGRAGPKHVHSVWYTLESKIIRYTVYFCSSGHRYVRAFHVVAPPAGCLPDWVQQVTVAAPASVAQRLAFHEQNHAGTWAQTHRHNTPTSSTHLRCFWSWVPVAGRSSRSTSPMARLRAPSCHKLNMMAFATGFKVIHAIRIWIGSAVHGDQGRTQNRVMGMQQ
jgi:hypothetical protein